MMKLVKEKKLKIFNKRIGIEVVHQFKVSFFSPRLDGLPLSPPPALGVKSAGQLKNQRSSEPGHPETPSNSRTE